MMTQAGSSKEEQELGSHYRYNWISFQPCEAKRLVTTPEKDGGQNAISVFAAFQKYVSVHVCVWSALKDKHTHIHTRTSIAFFRVFF